MADVVGFKGKKPENGFVELPDERAVIMATLENVMAFQERLEQGMRLMTDALAQTQSQVRSLEKEVAALKRKRPAILSATGERVN